MRVSSRRSVGRSPLVCDELFLSGRLSVRDETRRLSVALLSHLVSLWRTVVGHGQSQLVRRDLRGDRLNRL